VEENKGGRVYEVKIVSTIKYEGYFEDFLNIWRCLKERLGGPGRSSLSDFAIWKIVGLHDSKLIFFFK